MITIARGANLAVRFLLELALLAAVGAVVWQSLSHPVLQVVAVVGVLASAAFAWVALVHGPVPAAASAAAQIGALAIGAYGLGRIGGGGLAAAFTVTALVNAALLAAWNQ